MSSVNISLEVAKGCILTAGGQSRRDKQATRSSSNREDAALHDVDVAIVAHVNVLAVAKGTATPLDLRQSGSETVGKPEKCPATGTAQLPTSLSRCPHLGLNV